MKLSKQRKEEVGKDADDARPGSRMTEPPEADCFRFRYCRGGQPGMRNGFLSSPDFFRLAGVAIGPSFVNGNRIRELRNGDGFFPVMLDLIRSAKRSVTLETYIWSSGEISDQFIEVIGERARSGVNIHIIVDGFGVVKLDRSDMHRLKEAGAEFTYYERPRWQRVKANLWHRTHRKLLVIDGRVGVTGGFAIDDRWMGDGERGNCWRDNGYLVEGPVVAQMQAAFADNWAETTRLMLAGPDYFPELQPVGEQQVHVYHGAPGDRYGPVTLSFLMAIAAAERHVRIANAYFVPGDELMELLLGTLHRGVRVELVLPGHNDTAFGRAASRSCWLPLLEAGATIWLYEPAMYHCKYMIVDDLWVVAGSANFDQRSMTANDEVNFSVCDRGFAESQIGLFEEDKARSRRHTLEDHRRRPAHIKLADWIVGSFRELF